MTDITEVITSIAAAVPEQAKRNILHALGRLLGAAVDVPVAYLEGKAQGFRDDAAARTLVSRASAAAAAARIGEDPALADRAVGYYAERMLREQRNREAVSAIAAGELTARPPTEADAKPLSDDWLDLFARLAEGRSDADVQAYFGKLLAEEIRKPGSFSPATMHVLAVMTPAIAGIFKSACELTVSFERAGDELVFIPCDPFGSPGGNTLAPFGLSYGHIMQLHAAGLMHSELNARKTFPRYVFMLGVQVGKTTVLPATMKLYPQDDQFLVQELRPTVLNLTVAGVELRRIVHTEPSPEYIQRIITWTESLLARPVAS